MVHVLSYFQRSALPWDLRMSLLSHYSNLLIFHKHLLEKALFPYILTKKPLWTTQGVTAESDLFRVPQSVHWGTGQVSSSSSPNIHVGVLQRPVPVPHLFSPSQPVSPVTAINSIPDHQVGNSPKLRPLSTHLAITKPPRAIPDLLIPSTNPHPSPPASLPTWYSCQKHTGHPEVIWYWKQAISCPALYIPGIFRSLTLCTPRLGVPPLSL